MSGSIGGWGIGGVGAERTTYESELLWGADHARNGALWQSAIFSGAMRDAGNSPASIIRPGLLVGKVSASGEFEEWDADAADGTQDLRGICDVELRMTDLDAANADREFRVLVARAPVKARKLLIQGTVLTSHVDEFLARRALYAAGFTLDDDPFGYLTGAVPRFATVSGTTDTLLEAENGSLITYSNAASVTVTLPTIHPGLEFILMRTGDEEFIVTSAAGNDIIAGNDLSASTITFTTATEHLGAAVRIRGIYMGTTLKWLPEVVPVPFGTDLSALTYGVT